MFQIFLKRSPNRIFLAGRTQRQFAIWNAFLNRIFPEIKSFIEWVTPGDDCTGWSKGNVVKFRIGTRWSLMSFGWKIYENEIEISKLRVWMFSTARIFFFSSCGSAFSFQKMENKINRFYFFLNNHLSPFCKYLPLLAH